MAVAVNRLATARRTREFSLQVGQGQFEAEYTPLSEDDALGQAILKMRDDLANNEREMEAKVDQRTASARTKGRGRIPVRRLARQHRLCQAHRQAILPSEKDRAKVFDSSAVFYQPRDGVSGDFYWFHSVGRVRMFSAIDCTGHGVPGAFMSLIGHHALERITKVYTQPDRVLEQLNRSACALLRPGGFGEENAQAGAVNDGMDLAFVSIDMERMELEYSGANCPLYLSAKACCRNSSPTRWPLPRSSRARVSTKCRPSAGERGCVCLLVVFPTSLAGEGRNSCGRIPELLVHVATLESHEMEAALAQAFLDWKGEEEQVDDVLVIGVRV